MAREGYKEVSLEIPEEERDEWDEFWTKHGKFTSRSQFLRSAVSTEMAVEGGEFELKKPGDFDPEDLESLLEDVQADVDIEPLENAIYDLEDRIGDMEEQIKEQEVKRMLPNEQELKNLMHRCRDMIPLVEDEDELLELDAHASMPAKEKAQIIGTIGDVTAALRASEEPNKEDRDPDQDFEIDQLDVEKALTRLEAAYGHIHVTTHEGERRFYEVKQ